MANDNKIINQLLDLGRNIDKLTNEVKKNTSVLSDYSELDKEQTSDKFISLLESVSKDIKSMNSSLGVIKNNSQETQKLDSKKLIESISEPLYSLFSKSKIGSLSQNILDNFQTGGIAKKTGKYLVGENGPEVLNLPKGSSVIPINVKDLITGLSKVPELKNSIGDGEIKAYGNSEEVSILTGGSEDLKNRISLSKLQEKYQRDLQEMEGSLGNSDSSLISEIRDRKKSISDLENLIKNEISGEVSKISNRQETLLNKEFPDGIRKKDRDFLDSKFSEIFKKIPEDERNELSSAKASLLATETFLSSRGDKTSLGEKLYRVAEKVAGIKNAPKLSEIKTLLNNPTEAIKKVSGVNLDLRGNGLYDSEGSTYPSNVLKKLPGSLLEKMTTGGVKNSPNSESTPLSSLKKSVTNLTSQIPKKPSENLERELKNITSNLINLKPKEDQKKSQIKSAGTESDQTESKQGIQSKPDETRSNNQSGNKEFSSDLSEIKSLLARIAISLEGPLEVNTIDSPFRPDTRKI